MNSQDIREAWRTFLIELEFARSYQLVYQLAGAQAPSNPLLEKMLPSLLYIKMVAVLDEALDSYLDNAGLPLPGSYNSSLEGRISFCHDSNQITNGPELHVIRKRRNQLSHNISSSVTWPELKQDTAVINGTLQHLKFVGLLPHYEVKGERSAAQDSKEEGIAFVFDYSVKVLEGATAVADFRWQKRVHKD